MRSSTTGRRCAGMANFAGITIMFTIGSWTNEPAQILDNVNSESQLSYLMVPSGHILTPLSCLKMWRGYADEATVPALLVMAPRHVALQSACRKIQDRAARAPEFQCDVTSSLSLWNTPLHPHLGPQSYAKQVRKETELASNVCDVIPYGVPRSWIAWLSIKKSLWLIV